MPPSKALQDVGTVVDRGVIAYLSLLPDPSTQDTGHCRRNQALPQKNHLDCTLYSLLWKVRPICLCQFLAQLMLQIRCERSFL